MLKYLSYSLLVLVVISILSRCANMTAPTGGDKDTIPPNMVNSIPLNKSLNFKDKTIYLEFDERIKADKLKDQLIITPTISGDYENTIKKNIFKISFEAPFADSTTYTLNFREGIQDITESNPSVTNKFTFSTGTFIDSLSMFGLTTSLLDGDTLENVIVGLYGAEDTITAINGSPYYFSQSDKEGYYTIENIKNGKYFAIAFSDANKNLKLDFKNEAYAFKKDTLILDSLPVKLDFKLNRLDITPFRQMTALPSGKYFEVNFNKYVNDFSIQNLDSLAPKLFANLAKQNKSIRFYNYSITQDSIPVSYSATDSLNTTISDTVYVKFTDSKRKTDDFKFTVKPTQGNLITPELHCEIMFSKPVLRTNLDSLYIEYDTIVIQRIPDSIFLWNSHRDKLYFDLTIEKHKIDTLISLQNKKPVIQDTISERQAPLQQSSRKNKETIRKNTGLRLYIGHNTFLSVDQDTSISTGYNYKFLKPEDVGTQEVIVNTKQSSFKLQLLNDKFEIFNEVADYKKYTFRNIPPGKYRLRVLIDTNSDGNWDPGNLLNNDEPEPVYIYPETLIIRADWRTKLEISF